MKIWSIALKTKQWKPLNMITDNVIILDKVITLTQADQVPINKVLYFFATFAYCYQSVNVFSFSVCQSDHIKQLQQYNDYWALRTLIEIDKLPYFDMDFLIGIFQHTVISKKCAELCFR
jgi:hypothetical protein